MATDDFLTTVADDTDCSAESIELTQQGDDTADPGTHYFDLEPAAEGTYKTAELKKYHRNSSDTTAVL